MVNLTNLTLRHLVEENQLLVNGFINKIQTTGDNLLKLKIHTKTGDKNILITKNSFFVSNKSEQAKQNPGGFSALLKKYLYNQRIIAIKQNGFDRIVSIEFPNHFLILELFAKGNIVFCDKELNIIRAQRKEKWKDRELSKENKYLYPMSRGKNPLEINETIFFDELNKSEKTVFGAILDIVNVAPTILNHIFERNNFDKNRNANNTGFEDSKKMLLEIKKVYSKKREKVFIENNVLYSISLDKKIDNEYDSINQALNDLVERSIIKTEKIV